VYSDVSDIFAEATDKDPRATDQGEANTEGPNFSYEKGLTKCTTNGFVGSLFSDGISVS
jgi:hypothetical protein